MKKISFVVFCMAGLTVLAGCPQQVNQARTDSLLGTASNRWGTPNTRPSTAGYNGSPSEQVGEKSNSPDIAPKVLSANAQTASTVPSQAAPATK